LGKGYVLSVDKYSLISLLFQGENMNHKAKQHKKRQKLTKTERENKQIKRHALTDKEWDKIKDLATYKPARGRSPNPETIRLFLDAILWIAATGSAWRDLPTRFGPWESVYSRFRAYIKRGIFDKILEQLQQAALKKRRMKLRLVCFDGTYIRAHRHAAGARKKKTDDPKADAKNSAREQALGRSKGGFTTKVHMICDGRGFPLAFILTSGNTHDSVVFTALLALLLSRFPSMKSLLPKWISCDKAYDSQDIFDVCDAYDFIPVIPKRCSKTGEERANPDFDKSIYRERNHVERCIGWLKESRRVATRYEKLATTYSAILQLTMIKRFLKTPQKIKNRA
jgi:transposase